MWLNFNKPFADLPPVFMPDRPELVGVPILSHLELYSLQQCLLLHHAVFTWQYLGRPELVSLPMLSQLLQRVVML